MQSNGRPPYFVRVVESKASSMAVDKEPNRLRDCTLSLPPASPLISSLAFPACQPGLLPGRCGGRPDCSWCVCVQVVPERELPADVAATLVGRFTFFHGPGTQILSYLTWE